jgi:hypothetical protein
VEVAGDLGDGEVRECAVLEYWAIDLIVLASAKDLVFRAPLSARWFPSVKMSTSPYFTDFYRVSHSLLRYLTTPTF